MAFVSDFSKTPVQILLDLINNDNNCSLSPSYVTFGVPQAQPSSALRNTTVVVTAIDGSGFSGSQTLYYNRVDMSVIPGVRSTLIQVPTGAVNISDMIPNINTAFGINISKSDIVDGALPAFSGLPNEKHAFTLVAAAGCLVYNNQVALTAYNDGTNAVQVTNSDGTAVVNSDGSAVITSS